ncbi:MAG TPA: tannase/feruloyl esterase family alpha/beta hydrolase, partial [Pseudomonadales bacterium]
FGWAATIVPHAGNRGVPYFVTSAAPVIAYTLYGTDPGLLPIGFGQPGDALDTDGALPEWGWWQVDPDDLARTDLSASARVLDATDPDLRRFFTRDRGKLLLYQGLADSIIPPQPVIDYYDAVVKATFTNNSEEARRHMRLFLAPGMGHCRGGPGPDTVDWLSLLTAWVEKGDAPQRAIATHLTAGALDNERPLCPYPQRAVYVGPAGGANDRINWRERNFDCR